MSHQTIQNLIIVYFSEFLDGMGMSVVQPILPFYAEHFGASSLELGYLYSSFSFSMGVASVVMGKLSDKYGRKKIVVLSLFGTTVGFLLHGLAQNYEQLLVYRFLTGAFGGTYPIAAAVVTDVVPAVHQPTYLAFVGAVLGLSYIIGPGIGSGLAVFGLRVPFFVSSGMGLCGMLFALFLMRETHPGILAQRSERSRDKKMAVQSEERKSLKMNNMNNNEIEIKHLRSYDEEEEELESAIPATVWVMNVGHFFGKLAYSSFTSMSALFMIEKYGISALEMGFLTLVVALVFVICTAALFSRMNKRFGVFFTASAGTAVFGCGLGLCSLFDSVWVFAIFAVIGVGVGFGVLAAALTAMVAEFTNASNRGKILGWGNVAGQTGMVVGPIIYGALFEVDMRYPFLVAAGSAGVCLVIMLALYHRHPRMGMPPKSELQKMSEARHLSLATMAKRSAIADSWEFAPDRVSDGDYARLGRKLGRYWSADNYRWVSGMDDVIMVSVRKMYPRLNTDNYIAYTDDIDFITAHAEEMSKDFQHMKALTHFS